MDELHIHLARISQRRLNCFARYLLEGHPLGSIGVQAQHLAQVKGNRFPLAVGVRSQVHALRPGCFSQAAQVGDNGLLVLADDVAQRVAVLAVNANVLPFHRQVADVAHAGRYFVVLAGIALDFLNLIGTFYND